MKDATKKELEYQIAMLKGRDKRDREDACLDLLYEIQDEIKEDAAEITRLQSLIPVWKPIDDKCKDGEWLFRMTEIFAEPMKYFSAYVPTKRFTHYLDFVMPEIEE